MLADYQLAVVVHQNETPLGFSAVEDILVGRSDTVDAGKQPHEVKLMPANLADK